MDCVNHTGVTATAYCQNCGKALCATCVRNAAGGQILCEPCWTAWQSYPQPFAAPTSGAPSPAAAAALGIIPGVGAMYNGQFFKGLIHVVIFAVLISITDHYAIFGIFVAAWILYQSFEAYHTARARRDGHPLPDPLGLNEVGNWLNLGGRPAGPPQPGAPGANPGSTGAYQAGPYQAGYQNPYPGVSYQQTPYQSPYQTGYTPPAAGFTDPGLPPIPPIPPPPPIPPVYWRRKEPIGALVLIGLGVLFLLGQMNILSDRVFEYIWPLGLIALGVWLILRRSGDWHGGSK